MKESVVKIYVVTGCISVAYGCSGDDITENVKAFRNYAEAENFIEKLKLKNHKKNNSQYGGGRSYYKAPDAKDYGYYSMDIVEVELV